jgi:REP element-mobilizing transposase RayT
MPGNFSQIQIQAVFAVKGRRNLIPPAFQPELNKYIAGIITAKGQKPIIVNGVPDHIHIFFGLKPSACISDLVRDIKNNSSNFLNRQNWMDAKFQWQDSFGAFSYYQSHVTRVYNYMLNQQQHHKVQSFRDEYLGLLKGFQIAFDEKYLFEFYD